MTDKFSTYALVYIDSTVTNQPGGTDTPSQPNDANVPSVSTNNSSALTGYDLPGNMCFPGLFLFRK